MKVFCDKKQIVHHLGRIFEHDMIHLLKDVMFTAADDLIRVVHRSVSQRFHIRDLSFNLKFTDNFFKF